MSDFIRKVPTGELSNFHRELLQGFQKLASPPEPPQPTPKPRSEVTPVKIIQQAKPKKENVPKQESTAPSQARTIPVVASTINQKAVFAIANFLKDGKEATLAQLVAVSQAHQRDACAAIDWMQQERLIVRCGSRPNRYRQT